MKDVYILGIESSCDETAAAVIKNGREILSNVVLTQIERHRAFGGVVPEIASRMHIESISHTVNKALCDAGLEEKDITAIKEKIPNKNQSPTNGKVLLFTNSVCASKS